MKRGHRKLGRSVAVLGVILIVASATNAQQRSRPEMIPERVTSLIGRTAPEINATLLDGTPFSLAALRGRVVVVSFFASWCTPCRAELPALSELAARRHDVAIVAVNVDRDQEAARSFLASLRVQLPVILDNSAVALGRYGVVSMPTTFVIDRRGTVKHERAGFNRENGIAELEQAIAEARR